MIFQIAVYLIGNVHEIQHPTPVYPIDLRHLCLAVCSEKRFANRSSSHTESYQSEFSQEYAVQCFFGCHIDHYKPLVTSRV